MRAAKAKKMDIRQAQRIAVTIKRESEADYERRIAEAAKDPERRVKAMKDLETFWPD